MNDVLLRMDLGAWKPVLGALMVPPVPLLLLVVAGALGVARRRAWGALLVALGVAGLWFGATGVASDWLERRLLKPPPALPAARTEALRRDASARGTGAIVVLGGGMDALAPEYGTSSLSDASLQRLRYGLWLGRQTGLPVGFSGGTGWGGDAGTSEAEVASRIAAQEFGRPLRWTEGTSRDTRENAARMVPLLQRAGITHVVLVTHGWHMPRALAQFERAAAPAGIRIEPAPMGLAKRSGRGAIDWLPSAHGFARMRHVVHEWVGRTAGH